MFTRFCIDVLSEELRRQRPQVDLLAKPLAAATGLGDNDMGLDSLERLRLALALCDALGLEPTDPEDRMAGADIIGDMIADVRLLMAARPAVANAAIGFRSSGSQGAAKTVTQPWLHLQCELEHWAREFAHAKRVITLVSASHIYGFLFSTGLPAMLGVACIDGRRRLPSVVAASLQDGDLVVGHPVFWQSAKPASWRAPTIVLSSGGAVDANAFAAIAATPGCQGLEIYGSTETGGLGLRKAGEAGFELLPWWRRTGDSIARGVETPIALPDEVDWLGPRLLRPLRRRDGIVQIGGINVSLDYVASVLKAHSSVADARVRLMNSAEGERLKAFVVPALPGNDGLRVELDVWCKEKLQPLERPKAYTFGSAIPRSASGKDCDWVVA